MFGSTYTIIKLLASIARLWGSIPQVVKLFFLILHNTHHYDLVFTKRYNLKRGQYTAFV